MTTHFYFTALAIGRYEDVSNATVNLMFVGEEGMTPKEVADDFVKSFIKVYKQEFHQGPIKCCGNEYTPDDNFNYCPTCGAKTAPWDEEDILDNASTFFEESFFKGDYQDISMEMKEALENEGWYMNVGHLTFNVPPSPENSTPYYFENVSAAIAGEDSILYDQPNNLFLIGVTCEKA